jgi:amidase
MREWFASRMTRDQNIRPFFRPLASQPDCPAEFRLELLNGHDLFEITVRGLSWCFQHDSFTSADYVDFCLRRIHKTNPYLEAVIETNPDASNIARDLDRQRKHGQVGPLHGIPVLVKDNIATADAMQTTAGSWALLGSVVPGDATVVGLLRKAGAVIIGHANMSEWASCRSKSYSTGYSPRGGQVRNPYDLSRTPFGSSSGSAVAVAANLVPLALGTETDTSIIGPASINGVVGFKPTVGLTSRTGVIPISENMDSVGTFGRTVADAVTALDVIAVEDPSDRFTMAPDRPAGPLIQHLSSYKVLQGARFGRPHKRCWELVPDACKAVASNVFAALEEAGAEIIDVDLPSIEERVAADGMWDWEHGDEDKREWTVAKADSYNGINAYLAALGNTAIKSVEDIVTYNEANRGTEGAEPGNVTAFPTGHDNLVEIVQSEGRQDDIYQSALQHIQRQTREYGLDAALEDVDALLFCDRRGVGQQYAAQAGYPIICMPIGIDVDGLPVSLSVQHRAWREADLVKWASAIEDLLKRQTGGRPTPTFRNHLAKNIPIKAT